MTYKAAFEKINTAYIEGRINAYLLAFSFCGFLEDNTIYWNDRITYDSDVKSLNDPIIPGSLMEHLRLREVYEDDIKSLKTTAALAINYSGDEYFKIHDAFFQPLRTFFVAYDPNPGGGWQPAIWIQKYNKGDEEIDLKYEDALFEGLIKGLEILKQIHISRGEVIDETLVFRKKGFPDIVYNGKEIKTNLIIRDGCIVKSKKDLAIASIVRDEYYYLFRDPAYYGLIAYPTGVIRGLTRAQIEETFEYVEMAHPIYNYVSEEKLEFDFSDSSWVLGNIESRLERLKSRRSSDGAL